MKQRPANGAYIDTYAYILYRQGKYREALCEFLRADKFSDEPSSVIKKHLGDTYHALGEDDKAMKEWEQAFFLPESDAKLKGEILSNWLITSMKKSRDFQKIFDEKSQNRCIFQDRLY